MNKDCVFYFNFYNELDETETTYGFIIRGLTPDEIDDLVQSKEYEATWEELEQYGVHDWSSRPSDEVSGIGYTSYEISQEDKLTVMNKWRNYFAGVVGTINVTDVREVFDFESDDDYDIYLKLKQ